MATSVTINWAGRHDGTVLVDGTVAGTHHQIRVDANILDRLGSKSARQTFIAQQMVAANNAPTPTTQGGTGSFVDLAGTLSV